MDFPFFTCKLCMSAVWSVPAFLLWGDLVYEVLLLYVKGWLTLNTATCSRDLCLEDNLLKSPMGVKLLIWGPVGIIYHFEITGKHYLGWD